MYKNVWDYMVVDKKYKTCTTPTIEYDISYTNSFGRSDVKRYLIYFTITVPFISEKENLNSIDDLSDIVLEIATSKFECADNIKNIPLGYDNGCVSRYVSFEVTI